MEPESIDTICNAAGGLEASGQTYRDLLANIVQAERLE